MKIKILSTALALIASGTLAFAQEGKSQPNKNESDSTKIEIQKDSVYYTCSMHPEVKMNRPGKCPTCGMELEKKTILPGKNVEKKETLKMYTCTMHPEVQSDKPGKCQKCGMHLVKQQ